MGFDNFDFKDILNYAKPAAKAIGGVVKVAYGQGDGVNDVGDGLGGVLKAAGVDGDEGANPNEEQQSPSKPLDVFDMIPVKASPKAPQPNSAEQPKQAKPKSDRERVKELLLRRGWSEQEAEELLDGPKNKAEPGQRMKQQPGTRIAMSQGEMSQSTGVRLANREGRLTKGDEARRLTDDAPVQFVAAYDESDPADYIVQPGDTLESISEKWLGGASEWQRLYQANRNRIKNPNAIKPGLRLRFPPGDESEPYDYIVQPGDTLESIARKWLGGASEWPLLYEANRNRIKDPNNIKPGLKLLIPPRRDGSTTHRV